MIRKLKLTYMATVHVDESNLLEAYYISIDDTSAHVRYRLSKLCVDISTSINHSADRLKAIGQAM